MTAVFGVLERACGQVEKVAASAQLRLRVLRKSRQCPPIDRAARLRELEYAVPYTPDEVRKMTPGGTR